MRMYVQVMLTALVVGDVTVILGFSAVMAVWFFRVYRTVPRVPGQLIAVAGSPVAWLIPWLMPYDVRFWLLLVTFFAAGVAVYAFAVNAPVAH